MNTLRVPGNGRILSGTWLGTAQEEVSEQDKVHELSNRV